MNARCHTAQRRHVFALASCCNNNGSARPDNSSGWSISTSVFSGMLMQPRFMAVSMIFTMLRPSTTTFRPYLCAVLIICCTRSTLDANVAMISRVALMLMENRIKGMSYRPLRLCKALPFRVGGITHQRQHAFFSKLREPLQIDRFTKYRSIVHLKVTGMDNCSRRRMDRQCSRVHDAMVRLDKFDPELSQIYGLSEFDHLTLRVTRADCARSACFQSVPSSALVA